MLATLVATALATPLHPGEHPSEGPLVSSGPVMVDSDSGLQSGGSLFLGTEVAGVRVFVFDTIDIAHDVVITGSQPVAILSRGDLTLSGTIVVDASATGTVPGPGGYAGGVSRGAGQGPAGGAGDSGTGNGGDGGGHCGRGGRHGGGLSPGLAYGDLLVLVTGGSGGGGGSQNGTDGGGGGGAIELGALGDVVVGAGVEIRVRGAAGDDIPIDDDGAGGGAGGGILVHGAGGTIAGTLDARGGDGGNALQSDEDGGGGGGGGCVVIAGPAQVGTVHTAGGTGGYPDGGVGGSSSASVPTSDGDGDGWVSVLDCDDSDPDVNRGELEICDGIDNDCANGVDDGGVCDDGDGDGFTTAEGDCDDTNPSVSPSGTELPCNGVDDDCDPLTADEVDDDGDGYGGCPSGPDCDDTDPDVHPGSTEVACDLDDNDCDPATPDALDDDGDGFDTCVDCDDGDPSVHPGQADATCDGVDDDCDGLVDEEASEPTDWYADADGDGAGSGSPTLTCDPPPGFVELPGDCDDDDPSRSPLAAETCNGVDDDCDGAIDDADPNLQGETWYVDADLDGVGSDTLDTSTCGGGLGLVSAPGDCDDTDPGTYPGAPEPCEGVDRNCDGVVDGGYVYPDLDGDGFGDGVDGAWQCDGEGIEDGTDCDDGDATVHPGATDPPGDGIDQDCDGADGVDLLPSHERPSGCACDGAARPAGGWLLTLLVALIARRRRNRALSSGAC